MARLRALTFRLVAVAILAAITSAVIPVLSPIPARACEDNPGPGPFTVVGWVTDEAGQPLPDLTLILVPVVAGTGETDLENGVYRIDDRDNHQTKTNADGLFVMPGVYDYRVTDTHLYQVLHADPISYPERNPFLYLSGGLVDFTDLETGMVKTKLVARPAGGLRIVLRGATGEPYNGMRALLVETAQSTLVYSARFDDGVHLRQGIPPGQVKVGLLDGELAYFVQQRAHRERRPLADYLMRKGEKRLEETVTIRPEQYSPVEFVLP